MRSKFMTLLTVVGALTVLVLAGNTVALATTGKAILAGKINTSAKMTSITRSTPGTGLQVKTKSTANAPFAVNGRGKVTNLNADTIDGLDSSRLTTTPYVVTKKVTASNSNFTIPLTVPAGSYLASYSAYFSSSPAQSLGSVACYFQQSSAGVTRFIGEQDIKTDAFGSGVSGSGLVTKSASGILNLTCITGASAITGFGDQQPIQVVLTKVDTVKPLAARVAAGRSAK